MNLSDLRGKYVDRFTFSDALQPILKILRIFGSITYRYDIEGNIRCDFRSRSTIYNFVVYFCTVILILMTYQQATNSKVKVQIKSLDKYLFVINQLPQLLGPIPFLMQAKRFQRFFQKWAEFEGNYYHLTGKKLNLEDLKEYRTIAKYLTPVIGFFPLTPITFHPYFNIGEYRAMEALCYSINHIQEFGFLLYWLMTSKAIEITARQLKNDLIQEIRIYRGYTSNVEAYRLLWLHLSRIAKNFASSIGVIMTVYLITHIFFLTIALYRGAIEFPEFLKSSENEIHWSFPSLAALSILKILLIFLYCNIAHNVPAFCTEDMLAIVTQIRDTSYIHSVDEAKVNLFLFTLNEYAPDTNVNGFYEINRSLFGKIISVLITYVIVIIQLNSS